MALPKYFKISNEVQVAQRTGKALVALESAVLTHGLPRPQNLELARELETIVGEAGATPASIGMLDGRVLVGMEAEEQKQLSMDENARKLSARDLASAVADEASGGTTVAATLRVAGMAGIQVFATGGIGGVHRDSHWDVSADLLELARQPVLVVCAGAKSILDLPATLEQLETLGVPVAGWETESFPAFYSQESGLKLNAKVKDAESAAELARTHWELGGRGIVLAAPPPAEEAIPFADVEDWIEQAQSEAEADGIQGQAVSPYLLKRVSELSDGRSLKANLALLKNNARIAAEIARQFQPKRGQAGLIPKKA